MDNITNYKHNYKDLTAKITEENISRYVETANALAKYLYDENLISCVKFCNDVLKKIRYDNYFALDMIAYCAVAMRELEFGVAPTRDLFKNYVSLYDRIKGGEFEKNQEKIKFFFEDEKNHHNICEKFGIFGAKEPLVLTVAMMVKNEAGKYLERCLKSMQPLLNAVKSELVIVDTGSTDNTVEICKKYTPYVYDFEWINDYSAPRNYGIEKIRELSSARGYAPVWYMFVDADEIFQDNEHNFDDMIRFFNDYEVNKNHDTARYAWWNLRCDSEDDKVKTIFRPTRICRFTPELKFKGKIHEGFQIKVDNIKDLDTWADHYGYAKTNYLEYEKKITRYNKLMREELLTYIRPELIDKSVPENELEASAVRIITHIFQSYHDIFSDEFREYATELLRIAPKYDNVAYTCPALIGLLETFTRAIRNYKLKILSSEHLKFLVCAEKAHDRLYANSVAKSALFYLYLYQIYFNISDFKNSYRVLKKQLNAYKDYDKPESQKEIIKLQAYTDNSFLVDEDLLRQIELKRIFLQATSDEDNAIEKAFSSYKTHLLESADSLEKFSLIKNQIINIIIYSENYDFAQLCLDALFENKKEQAAEVLRTVLIVKFRQNPAQFLSVFDRKKHSQDPFYEFIDIIKNPNAERILKFIKNLNTLEEADIYSDIFYQALKQNISFINVIPEFISKETFSKITLILSLYREDFPAILTNINITSIGSLKELSYASELTFAALIGAVNLDYSDIEVSEILLKYAEITALFVQNVYSENTIADFSNLKNKEHLSLLIMLFVQTGLSNYLMIAEETIKSFDNYKEELLKALKTL